MAAASESKRLSSEDLNKEVQKFVKSSSHDVWNDGLVQSGLLLLRHLPAVRHAVLQYLCNVFDDATNSHILALELGNLSTDSNIQHMHEVVLDIQGVLLNFVKTTPEAWAPIISEWSIDLLGQISNKYAGKRGVTRTGSLNELMELWMNCKPTMVLLEIASECFASMMSTSPDVCVDALLDASVKHSPHFDWVVAHIGSCFPTTIINRVLMCGLKEYNVSQADGKDEKQKVASVVGILGHLASQHSHDIRKALLTLFKESLKNPVPSEEYVSAIPYLLQMASMSSALLQIIATDFSTLVNANILNQIAVQFFGNKNLTGKESDGLLALVVHLLTKSSSSAFRLLQIVFDAADPTPNLDGESSVHPKVRTTCRQILEKLLIDLQKAVHGKNTKFHSGPADLPILQTLQYNIPSLCKLLIEGSDERCEWVGRILGFVAVHCGENRAAEVLVHILHRATNTSQLSQVVLIMQEAQIKHPEVLSVMANGLMGLIEPGQEDTGEIINIIKNLVYLVRWEKTQSGKKGSRTQLQLILHEHITSLATQLTMPPEDPRSLATLQLLHLIALPPSVSIATLTALSTDVVALLFNSLFLLDTTKKLAICNQCKDYVRYISRHSAPQKLLIRGILEATLSPQFNLAFGAAIQPPRPFQSRIYATDEKLKEQLLYETNKRKTQSAFVPVNHNSVYHGGIIGKGLKIPPRPSPFTQEEQSHNKQLMLDMLWICCTQKSNANLPNGEELMETDQQKSSPKTPGSISATMARQFGLLLIELVAPDVIYNGTPWPEEEFMKVTVERDLQISNLFEENPVLWDVMDIAALGPGAMCYCSSILRGVTAVLLSFWDAYRGKSASDAPKQLNTTCRLINCMRKGQLLAAPLSYIGELLPHIAPFEVHLLLRNMWTYMKENPPTAEPHLGVVSERYTEVIRAILHSNIDKVGHLYNRFIKS